MDALPMIDLPPDWAGLATELHCPLCEYNLRGLEQPRCPECGFVFTWAEIVRGQSETHPYLFEHHPRRNVWSFFQTYFRDCRPRTFWRKLNPAQPVRLGRLVVYWVLANLLMLATPVTPLAGNLWNAFQSPTSRTTMNRYYYSLAMRRLSSGGPGPAYLPPPPPPATTWDRLQDAWDSTRSDFGRSDFIAAALVILAWPWCTFLCLLIFVESMRRAKIRKRHIMRAAIYGTDFGLVMLVALALGALTEYASGWFLLVALVCAAVTLYRVYFAYSLYLRFHLPFATVLSSQIILYLAVWIVYLQQWVRW